MNKKSKIKLSSVAYTGSNKDGSIDMSKPYEYESIMIKQLQNHIKNKEYDIYEDKMHSFMHGDSRDFMIYMIALRGDIYDVKEWPPQGLKDV